MGNNPANRGGGALSPKDTLELLGKVPLFEELSPAELERIAAVAVPRSFPKAVRVFHEGDSSDACYIVRSGDLRVTREHSDGRAIALAFAVLLVLQRGAGRRVERSDWGLFVLAGLTGYTLYQLGFILGLSRTSPFSSSLLIAMVPLFTVLILAVRGESTPLQGWVGLGVALVGAVARLAAPARWPPSCQPSTSYASRSRPSSPKRTGLRSF